MGFFPLIHMLVRTMIKALKPRLSWRQLAACSYCSKNKHLEHYMKGCVSSLTDIHRGEPSLCRFFRLILSYTNTLHILIQAICL